MIPKYLGPDTYISRETDQNCKYKISQLHSQQGVMARNDLGFILWKNNEEKTMNYNLVGKRSALDFLKNSTPGISLEDSSAANLGDVHQQ